MKQIAMLLMLLVSLATANAKCDWSTLKLQQWNERNYYKWYLGGKVFDDTCIDYMFTLYDYQTKELDTVLSIRGVKPIEMQYYFSNQGKYSMSLKVWNKCLGCDTTLYREVDIIYFPNCTFTYRQRSTKRDGCLDSIVGEMSVGPQTMGDTCWEYYLYMWNGPMLDAISDDAWNNMSDYQLWNYYVVFKGNKENIFFDFNDSDLVWLNYPDNSTRLINYKFPKNGHYLIATQWYNKCVSQDTVFLNRVNIKCVTSGVKTFNKQEPKLVGIYDMMGRPANKIKENELYLFLYEDKTVKKMIKTKQ